MLILIEDPSKTDSVYQRQLQRSQIRSHAAHIRHRRRDPDQHRKEVELFKQNLHKAAETSQRTSLSDLCVRLDLPQTPTELRFLQFYRERTSSEWSGWQVSPVFFLQFECSDCLFISSERHGAPASVSSPVSSVLNSLGYVSKAILMS